MFPDHMDMVRDWDKLGFVVNIGRPGHPRFAEMERRLPRDPPRPPPKPK